MASNRPVLHAPDHLKGGPDPILGMLGVEYAALASNGTVALPDSSAPVEFDFQGMVASAGADVLTDNPETFQLAVASGTEHVLQISEPGLYLAFATITVAAELTTAAAKDQHLSFSTETVATTFSQSSWVFSGNSDHSYYGNQSVAELWAIGAEGPIKIVMAAENGRGGGTGDAIAQAYLLVVRLGSRDMTALPVLY